MPAPSGGFRYPQHLDGPGLDALPAKPGVYFFRDAAGDAIYVGKSVNIRSRVLAHLRAPDEAAMLEESRAVDFVRTAGEIGALLLESRLIKQLQPRYNVLLREVRQTHALRIDPDSGQPHAAVRDDGAPAYGLFASRSAAEEGLRRLLRRHGLCPAVCGLETTVRGRACFAHQLGCCRGACIGSETADAHAGRLREALEKLEAAVWPFDGAVGIVEECDGWRQTHVVDRWCYLGSLEGHRRTLPRRPVAGGVDIDTYNILFRPILTGELPVIPLASSETAANDPAMAPRTRPARRRRDR
ncbi:MAG: endonuclease [Burkholderiaceae bacterium]